MLRFLFWLLIIWLAIRLIRTISISFQRRVQHYPPQQAQKKSPLNVDVKIEDAEFEELPSDSKQEKQSS